jgi:hypothetical protein
MQSPAYSKITRPAPLTIIGKDLDVGATFNADLNPNSGQQRAGRLMSYDKATKQLTPWDGIADANGQTIFGVLADDVDITGDNINVTTAVMVYRAGLFLRQEIESANNAAITPDGVIDNRLRDLGISLEQSYEAYLGVNPVPAGVEPMEGAPVEAAKQQPPQQQQPPPHQPPPPKAAPHK